MRVSVWYADGHVEHDWEGSPHEGVQVVCWTDELGGQTCTWGVDEYFNPFAEGTVKYGAWVSDEEFRRIMDQAGAPAVWG